MMDRRAAPVLRQQRRMNIHTTKPWSIQDLLRHDLAIGACHDQLRLVSKNRIRFRPQFLRLQNGNTVFLSQGMDRRFDNDMFSSHRFVRLGNHGSDMILLIDQSLQDCAGEFRCAKKNNAGTCHMLTSSYL